MSLLHCPAGVWRCAGRLLASRSPQASCVPASHHTTPQLQAALSRWGRTSLSYLLLRVLLSVSSCWRLPGGRAGVPFVGWLC